MAVFIAPGFHYDFMFNTLSYSVTPPCCDLRSGLPWGVECALCFVDIIDDLHSWILEKSSRTFLSRERCRCLKLIWGGTSINSSTTLTASQQYAEVRRSSSANMAIVTSLHVREEAFFLYFPRSNFYESGKFTFAIELAFHNFRCTPAIVPPGLKQRLSGDRRGDCNRNSLQHCKWAVWTRLTVKFPKDFRTFLSRYSFIFSRNV